MLYQLSYSGKSTDEPRVIPTEAYFRKMLLYVASQQLQSPSLVIIRDIIQRWHAGFARRSGSGEITLLFG